MWAGGLASVMLQLGMKEGEQSTIWPGGEGKQRVVDLPTG